MNAAPVIAASMGGQATRPTKWARLRSDSSALTAGRRNLALLTRRLLGFAQVSQSVQTVEGFVYLPREALWLADYLHEMATFPSSKYDDQADSTSQALAWMNSQPPEHGIIEFQRREYARMMHRQGLSLELIAAKVKSTPAAIDRWIK